MKAKEHCIFFLSVFLMLLSLNTTAQDHHLPQLQMASSDDPVVPPGLVVPIDDGVHFLAAAGFLLGIYSSRPKNLMKIP